MNILVINCGSRTIKFQVIDVENKTSIIKGAIKDIGEEKGHFQINFLQKSKVVEEEIHIKNHKNAFETILEHIDNDITLKGIGHRLVHGGDFFTKPTLMNEQYIEKLKDFNKLAPLHNPYGIIGIRSCIEILPHLPQVACFDTDFHQEKPLEHQIYPLPYEFYEKHKIRKYGFHGMSHKYIIRRISEILNIDFRELKIVSCHFGGGGTVVAIQNGIAIDTTATFGTMGGVIMGTRSGDFDPSLILYMMENLNMTAKDIFNTLYKKSGLIAISGISSEIKDLEKPYLDGHERTRIAVNMYVNSIKKYIGSFIALMNGIDVLSFTGGIGENNIFIREKICSDFSYIGAFLDRDKNNVTGQEAIISSEDSKVKIMVIPTNEELVIAEEVINIIHNENRET